MKNRSLISTERHLLAAGLALGALDTRQRALCIQTTLTVSRNNPNAVLRVREAYRTFLVAKLVLFGVPL